MIYTDADLREMELARLRDVLTRHVRVYRTLVGKLYPPLLLDEIGAVLTTITEKYGREERNKTVRELKMEQLGFKQIAKMVLD